MKITAIILNYKNYQDVCVCIKSLEKQNLTPDNSLKILIIDNNSQDDSTEKLNQHVQRFCDAKKAELKDRVKHATAGGKAKC